MVPKPWKKLLQLPKVSISLARNQGGPPAGSVQPRECRPGRQALGGPSGAEGHGSLSFQPFPSNPGERPLHTLRLVTSRGGFVVHSLKRKRCAGLHRGRGDIWSKRFAKERPLRPCRRLIGNRLAGRPRGVRPRGLRLRAFPPNSFLGFRQKPAQHHAEPIRRRLQLGGAAGPPPPPGAPALPGPGLPSPARASFVPTSLTRPALRGRSTND